MEYDHARNHPNTTRPPGGPPGPLARAAGWRTARRRPGQRPARTGPHPGPGTDRGPRHGLIRRAAAAAGAAVVLLGPAVWAAGPAAAAPADAGPAVLYAYAGGLLSPTVSCPQDTASPPVPGAECNLWTAIALAKPGDTIY